jgi:hypothetical protein
MGGHRCGGLLMMLDTSMAGAQDRNGGIIEAFINPRRKREESQTSYIQRRGRYGSLNVRCRGDFRKIRWSSYYQAVVAG